MSTRLSKGKIDPQPPSLMFALENAVLALEANGMDENTIFGMVNCVLKGYIRNGEFAPEYIQHVENIIQEKQELAKQEEFRRAFGSGSSVGSS
jgi:hypothetical protein